MPLFDRSFFSQLQGLRMVSKRQVQGRLFGEARGRRTGRSGEFADHRPYLPGEDIRDIDWPAFWRLRKPFVKLSESHEECPVFVALDASASMGFGEPTRWDYGRRLAAAIAFIALDNGHSVHCLAFAERPEPLLHPLRGIGQFRELCDRLEGVPLAGHGPITNGLASLPRFCPGRGMVLVVSDFLAEEKMESSLSALAGPRHEVAIVHLVTPWESSPELEGEWELEDAETGTLMALKANDHSLALYRRNFAGHCEMLRTLALRRGMRYVFASTDKPEIVQVRRLLKELGSVV